MRERGVDTLRLLGDFTNICVLYTAADARNLGYGSERRSSKGGSVGARRLELLILH